MNFCHPTPTPTFMKGDGRPALELDTGSTVGDKLSGPLVLSMSHESQQP